MVANRLRKNLARLKGWRRQHNVRCFRLYDADLPEYAVAIDAYEVHGDDTVRWHVQEYAPPASVPAQKAARRLEEVCDALCAVTGASRDALALKTRQIGKGGSKYGRMAARGDTFVVGEGKVLLEINLHDYLDTGLFLDHRPIRLAMAALARAQPGLRCANLFCYTGAASVHLAAAGARTVSVDLSATYLDWAQRNFALNNLPAAEHEFARSDVLRWLASTRASFDLIFCDPPTFSNSKKAADFDVQRDHVQLLRLALDRLAPRGLLIFSNNNRRFHMDPAVSEMAEVKEVSAQTIDRDFARNERIHRCFELRRPTPGGPASS